MNNEDDNEPSIIASTDLSNKNGGWYLKIDWQRSYAFITGKKGFSVVDFNKIEAPEEIATIFMSNAYLLDIYDNNYIIIADGEDDYVLVDISTKSNLLI